MSGLEGKSVIVTGGGTGIGAACARRLAADGASVTIAGRTESRLADVAASIEGEVHTVAADVTVEDDVAALVSAHVERFGGLSGFVANAGGGGGMSPYHLQNTDEFLRVLHLNVLGTMLSVKHSVPHLVKTKGSFVGMSSLAGHRTHLWFGAYTVSKAGLWMLTQSLALALAPHIRVNAIGPGPNLRGERQTAEHFERQWSGTPLGRGASPEEICDAVRFILAAPAMTGQMIALDGGQHLGWATPKEPPPPIR